MRNIYLCLLAAALLFSGNGNAQTITSHSVNGTDPSCGGAFFSVRTSSYSSTLFIQTFFGDGTFSWAPVMNGGSYGYISIAHGYNVSGQYRVKQVLYDGGTPLDSITELFTYDYCRTMPIVIFADLNNNCMYDAGIDKVIRVPITLEVDSAGIAIDTVSCAGGLYYRANGGPGTVYAFKPVSYSAGMAFTCFPGGIIYDTVQPSTAVNPSKFVAMTCGGGAFDLTEGVSAIAGRHLFVADIIVDNLYCTNENATLTMNFTPKYSYRGSSVIPASSTPTSVTWNIPEVSVISPGHIHVTLDRPTLLITGDTVNTDYTVSPESGDANTGNNHCHRQDTVNGSFDPNSMMVSPEGVIRAGTRLTYTVTFENTGNDTAFNIHIMDTLSDDLDPQSMQMIASSAVTNVAQYFDGGHNIIKFDFPNINLLDSTHHDLCDGSVIFSIATKGGLPFGTRIDNEAGIYFDYNPVVMTNTVENIIGNPTSVKNVASQMAVKVYPNPANDELTIQTETGAYSAFTISNMMGQQLAQQELFSAQTKVDVKNLPAGMYIISLKGDNGVKVVKFEKL